ncbi:PTS transporter subunit EIIC, partial [Escherichia coli]|nr:PTS transporter subunit EIIC [Escherichia coli]
MSCFTTMGGAGCTIGLLFAMLLASKRSDHRTIAKLSLAPGLFNINETMTFGLPIVLNPIFMIPFILTPVITA